MNVYPPGSMAEAPAVPTSPDGKRRGVSALPSAQKEEGKDEDYSGKAATGEE